ncbi:uncharacterized protein [Blastocystis hominis]|uniref:Nudix hydrolase domain-containing protein n=1 Tax=Blastocystis hominis TaxID=12968 RepID=D8M226_BLAHO|nr:uncharacterized protein [Blastocystis hominis]CBK22115.2 unnamed protein product [Blastocystis hominis]|eukprot:XP_012896163.1 uncharacterized protein [Blastocystis hominis]
MVTVDRKYASKACGRHDLEEVIDQVWNDTLKEKPYLFNQSKFRFSKATYDKTCHMMLGLTNYKAYVGSNLGPKWKLFYEEGMKIGDPDAYFGNPLGNQVAIVLKDGKHVIMNRSYQVAESQGKLTAVGGHPEPSELHIESYEDAAKIPSSVLTNELFESMRREVHEETNIPLDLISEMYMTGVIGSNATHGRQVQVFCCFVPLESEQVRGYYRKGPEDQYESLGINFMTLEEIVEIMNTTPDRFCPESRALYTALLQSLDAYYKVKDSIFAA